MPLRSTLWSTASRSPAAWSPSRPRACSTVRPAGSDLDRPSTTAVTEDPRSSSPPSATAISVAVSRSSSHARRVSRSLASEGEGARRRPRVVPPGWWSWVDPVGACSNDPHDSGEVRSAPNYYKQATAGKLHLLRPSTLADGDRFQALKRIRPRAPAADRPFVRTHSQRQHGGRQPNGAWAVPDDLAVDPPSPGLGMPSGVVDHPAQVRSSTTTIRSGSRTQYVSNP
jgi:hypothetical protein